MRRAAIMLSAVARGTISGCTNGRVVGMKSMMETHQEDFIEIGT